MLLEDIIVRPVVTEKSTGLRDKNNVYVFVVDKNANKIQVKEAIQKLFNVSVVSVNMINVDGKLKRVRYKAGLTASYKKAYIKIKAGDKIGIFEGA